MNEKKKVLVICRSSVGQMYLGVVLNRIWYAPVLAKTVGEGILLAQKEEFSLVLFDADLPDDERIAAATAMRADPSLAELPRVALMTTNNYTLPESLLPEGWAAVVSKPIVDIAQLYDVLRQLSEEPRKTPRVPVRMRVEIQERVPQQYLSAVNISEGGMYLRTHEPLSENTVLHLLFTLPLDPDIIQVAGTVVRAARLGAILETEPGMGLRFVDIPEDTKNRIRNFVQWSLIGDLEWDTAVDAM
ncbi:MAG: PilZ domain-containing protein [Nitrospirota bacterium]